MDEINLIYETYHLPEIKKEGLTEIEYNHRCKYLRLYIRLIKKCQSMTKEELSGYTEKHHILPGCLGGERRKYNLVELPVKYHVMAHIVLTIIYPEEKKVWKALSITIARGNKNRQKDREEGLNQFSLRTLTRLRLEAQAFYKSKEYRESISGENNPFFGKTHSLETRKRLSEAGKGKKLSPEVIDKMKKGLTGQKRTEETRKRISVARKGMKFSDSHRENISKSRIGIKYKSKKSEETWNKFKEKVSGENHWNSIKVINSEGKIFNCISDAAKYANTTKTTMARWIKGKTKNNHGWSFYNE